MKNHIYHLKSWLLLFFMTVSLSGYAQIILNPTPNTANCSLGVYGNANISVPSEALTGDNISLSITLPGTLPTHCAKTVEITRSSNLLFEGHDAVPFSSVPGSPLTHVNSAPIIANDGQSFLVYYKFPAFTTCNGTVGTFNITIKINCDGTEQVYHTSINITARAANYWSVTKEFIAGNLTCGMSLWRIKLHHNNPNGVGLGAYKIQGVIAETPGIPIISGSSFPINENPPHNSHFNKDVTLQNCGTEGSIITNTAEYNFTLGDGSCGVMQGSVTAVSPPLTSPNASISLVKSVVNPTITNLTPGCEARYQIAVCNNGNVPWTNLILTDNFNIAGINLTGPHQIPSGWTLTNTAGVITLTNTQEVLTPGECLYFYLDFQIDPNATIGSTISNTALLSYQAQGESGTGGGSTPIIGCPGINCPTITTAIQNTSDTEEFKVEAPKSIPFIKKCIVDPPNTMSPPLYQIGESIKFSLMVANSGAANLNTIVSDVMSMPGQNLEIIPGSINYRFYTNESIGFRNTCNPVFGSPQPSLPFTVSANTSNLQSPTWNISGMPGICTNNRANYLIIEFEAKVLPQLYGTKTNKASIPYQNTTLSSLVNYTIGQNGVLSVHKKADNEIVENGQAFNYIIKVTNNGSVALNQIVLNDQLPSCAVISNRISIKDGAGNNISYTNSGNIQININPAISLQPGDTFTITVPVTKSGSGNCCNESVSATGKMVPSGILLSANYGSSTAPAACVRGTECCDIAGFNTSINVVNGKYYVNINGGTVPIQEVEISMMDYHVSYSEKDCQPADMGIFGTLATSTTALSGLILNAADQNTASLTWLPGSPSVLNTNVLLDILDPLKLNLACCDVTFSFCLKVRVKDVNCNVCEKIICYTYAPPQEPEPEKCGCGKWKTNGVSIVENMIATGIPSIVSPQKKAMIIAPPIGKKVECAGLIQLKRNISYAFTAPDYLCAPENCEVAYQWQIEAPNGVVTTGTGKTFNKAFNLIGNYKIMFIPICGGNKCEPCQFTVRIPGIKETGTLQNQDLKEMIK